MANSNNHGGKRAGAGRPRKPLADKILEGTTKKHKPKVLEYPHAGDEIDHSYEFQPRTDYYAAQQFGLPNCRNIWEETVHFLEKTGCLHLINPQLIEDYVIAKNRFYEIERVITKVGTLYSLKKDTSMEKKDGNMILMANPLLGESTKYMKMALSIWHEIWEIVRSNCENEYGAKSESETERLIRISLEGDF